MNTKLVCQLDHDGYFVGLTVADESPLEPGVWLIPAGAVDADAPEVPEGFRAKWTGAGFDMEAIPVDPEPEPEPEPEPGVPTVVTMRQARLALHAAGLLHLVDAALDNLEEPHKTTARIEWEYSQEVQRGKPIVQMLAPALGLSEADLDTLFTEASNL